MVRFKHRASRVTHVEVVVLPEEFDQCPFCHLQRALGGGAAVTRRPSRAPPASVLSWPDISGAALEGE
jgi:hypothetical protein